MPATALLAIDFGTSNTVGVLRQPGTADRPLLFGGSPVMPSAVFLDETGRFHTGREANRMAQLDPAAFEPHPKLRVSDDLVLLGDREVPAVDLVTAVLDRVRRAAVEVLGTAPPVVLTHPARWGPHRIAVLEQAAAAAELTVDAMVAEPVAAAHRFAGVEAAVATAGPIGVFDLGGGTFDIAVLRGDKSGRFAVAAQGGQTDLGGVDLDQAIVGHLGGLVEQRHPELWRRIDRPEAAADRRAHRQFWDDVREAKEMLSQSPMAPIALPGLDTALHLTREEVDRLAAPFIEEAVALTGRVIGETGCAPSDLAGLFLVGGASRMPLVGRMLHQRLQVAPTVLEQPELAVAQGALDAAEQSAAPPVPPESAPTSAPGRTGPGRESSPPYSPTGQPGSEPPMPPPSSDPILPPHTQRPTRSPVVAAGLGAFVVLADFTAAVVAVPTMGNDLGVAISISQFLVGSYALALAGLILVVGSLVDRWGLKRTCLVGLTGFTAASLVCALAPGMGVLLLGRVLQGAAAAAILAPSMALLNRARRDRGRTPAFGVWGAVGGPAAVAGLVIGGGLTQYLGWRTVFLVDVLVGIVVIILGAATLTESRHTGAGRLDLRTLARPGFVGAALTALLVSVAGFGYLIYTSMWIQWGLGLSPVAAALALLPIVVAASVISAALAPVLRKVAPWIGVCLGLALIGAGGFLQSGLDSDSTWWSPMLGLYVAGIGVGLCVPSLNTAASAAAPEDRSAVAAWALNTSSQGGFVLGILVMGAVYSGVFLSSGHAASTLNYTMIAAGSIALIGAIPAALLVSRSRPTPESRDEPVPAATGPGR